MLLEIKNVTNQYDAHLALDSVSISVPKGSIFGLLGPNGAGKTSLIRIITQITKPDEGGELFFNGKKLEIQDIERVGYLPEERGLYKKMKVGEQLFYLAQLKGMDNKLAKERINHWLNKFDIVHWKNKNVEELSKGMQQKVQFIATVINEPELLILDEPFSGFDPVNANLIKDEILELNKKGVTIIFSTHRMESVEELCEDICLIHHSKVVLEGKLSEIKEKYRTGTYQMSGKGSLSLPNVEILEERRDERKSHYTFKNANGVGSNALLKQIMDAGFEVESFTEVMPTINDIFLELVEGKVSS